MRFIARLFWMGGVLGLATWSDAQLEVFQVSYVDPAGGAPSLSSRFQFEYTYTPSAADEYLNVYVQTSSGPLWAVQNMPLLGQTFTGSANPITFSSYWDLGSPFSGFTSSIILSSSVTSGVDSGTPSGFFRSSVVGQRSRTNNGGVPSGVTGSFANPGNFVAGVPGFRAGLRTTMPNVTQERNYCGPGSAANSLTWLSGQAGKPPPETLSAMTSTLAGYMGNANTGNWDDAQVEGKLRYIKEKGLDLEVHYVGGEKLPTAGHYVSPNGNGTARRDGGVSWSWIRDEFNRGQDLMFMTDKHWVVAAGFVEIAGNKYLLYRDDPYQKGAATSAAEQAEIDKRWVWTRYDETNNTIDIGGHGHMSLKTVVATSPVPEPSTIVALGVGFAALLRRRRSTS